MKAMRLVISFALCLPFFVATAHCGQSEGVRLNLACNTRNDLYLLLRKNGVDVRVYATPGEAIRGAAKGSGVLILADSYPKRRTSVGGHLLEIAKQKELRLFIEYPDSLPGFNISDTTIIAKLERGVVVSDVFGKDLPLMSILSLNECQVIPVNVEKSLIVFGRIAGFDRAVYGLKGVRTYPLLFKKGNMLVAMTRLSNFATGRYEPKDYWKIVWKYILSWVSGKKIIRLHRWLSYVSPMYGKHETLPSNAMKTSIRKGMKWFFNGRFFVAPGWEKMYLKYQGNGESPYGPPPESSWQNGDGSLGVLEGHASSIYYNGTQEYRYWVRSDNQGQVAYTFAAAGKFLHNKRYLKIASNLGNFIFYHSDLRSGPKDEPQSPAFGLIGWATTHPWVFYEDDNARVLLGMIGAEAYMKTDRWDREIVEGIMANFRTTGRQGFRGSWISQDSLLKYGWRHYWDMNVVDPNPHYEAWMWACYLWLYSKTGYRPLLTKTEEAIRITMQDYPNKWIWMNGLQQERARMILPLAWLVRVDNTPEHRRWLKEMVDDLLKYQAPCGAIREELGHPANGLYGPPKSNEAYGTSEAPLIFKNGEPVADMLYTNNFAFFALNEAAHAMNDKRYMAAEKRLADFLIRIQIRSSKFKDLDGGWFRAFDYGLWDYWASNSDAGWGAWSTNTGWIQSWIICTEILLQQHQSFWSLTRDSKVNDVMPSTIKIMFGSKGLPKDNANNADFRKEFLQLCDLMIDSLRNEVSGRPFFIDSYGVRSLCVAYDMTGDRKYLDACRSWADRMVSYQKKMIPEGAYYMNYGRKPGEIKGDWYVADCSSIAMGVLSTAIRCKGRERTRLINSAEEFASLVIRDFVRPSGGVTDGFWPQYSGEWWCSSSLFGSFSFLLYRNTGNRDYLNVALKIVDWLNRQDLALVQPLPLSHQGPSLPMYVMECYSAGWPYLSADSVRKMDAIRQINWCLNWAEAQQQIPVEKREWPLLSWWGAKYGGLPFHDYIYSRYLSGRAKLEVDGDRELKLLAPLALDGKPGVYQLRAFMMMSYAERLDPGAIYK